MSAQLDYNGELTLCFALLWVQMYFIEKGEVEVLSLCETSVVTRFKAGQYFGEQSLLFELPRAATIR